jgi:AraC family transcriptional regulator of adaptative response/methylated-DNA-[protein]-cysteine methyltransferase
LQRSFKRIVGVSPQAYLEGYRMTKFKTSLQEQDDIAGALYEAGFGSSSRLYAKSSSHLGMTPKTYQAKGKDTLIRYAIGDSPLDKLLVAATDKGICAIRLADEAKTLEQELFSEFQNATFRADHETLTDWLEHILRHLEGKEPHLELPLDVRASAFQKRVWQELQRIPYGETRSYQQVAEAIGQASAVRAVASACAKNPTALLVPCHRVVHSDGSLSGYRWGVTRKQKLLEGEAKSAA